MRQSPGSQPTALCAAYAPLLPLLGTDELSPDEVASVRAHAAGCSHCQAILADYDTLYGALRRQFGPEAIVSTIPAAHEIAAWARRNPVSAPSRAQMSRRSVVRPLPRIPFRAEVAAALLIVVLLGVLFGWHRGASSPAQAPLDPQAQAYLAVLHHDYPRVLDALGIDNRQCTTVFSSAPQVDKLTDMRDCRPVETTVVSASQALLTDLANTPPPSRWQEADGALRSWAQALIHAFTDRIKAIDGNDIAGFAALADTEVATASGLSCTPIQQINADLPEASQLPASASGTCSS